MYNILFRLYSDYLYFQVGIANKSPMSFHVEAEKQIQLMKHCIHERSVRACVYDAKLNDEKIHPVSTQFYLKLTEDNVVVN